LVSQILAHFGKGQRKGYGLFLSVLMCYSLSAQQALNNDSITKMAKAGLSDELIIATINSQPGAFNTSTDGIIALKSARVSDKVVEAVVAKAAGANSAPPPPNIFPAPPSGAATPAAAAALPADSSILAPKPGAAAQPAFHSTDGKTRIYITDRPVFESNLLLKGNAAAGQTQSGDDPRTVEVEADILKVCPAFVVASNNPDRADMVLIFRRRGGERSKMFVLGGLTGLALSAGSKVDGASLFKNDGDMIYATKQTTVEKAIKDVCSHVPMQNLSGLYR
jgi:hypothetical protein